MLPGAEKLYKIKSFDDLFTTLKSLKNELRKENPPRMKGGHKLIFLVIARGSTLHKFPIIDFDPASGSLPGRFTDEEERARFNRSIYHDFPEIFEPYHSVYLSNNAPKGTYPETSYLIDFYRYRPVYENDVDFATTEFTRFSDGFVQVFSDLNTVSNRRTTLRTLLKDPNIKVGAYIGILKKNKLIPRPWKQK